MRKVNLRLELVNRRGTARRTGGAATFTVLLIVLLHALSLIHFNRARVRFLFRDTNPAENVENHFAFYLELPCKVVDSNLLLLLHSALFSSVLSRTG
jgi:hypothetical protein